MCLFIPFHLFCHFLLRFGDILKKRLSNLFDGVLNNKFTGVGSDCRGDEQESSCSSSWFKLSGLKFSTLISLAWGKALTLLIELRKSVLFEDNLTARKRHGYIQATLIKEKHYFSSAVRIVLIAHCFNGTIK